MGKSPIYQLRTLILLESIQTVRRYALLLLSAEYLVTSGMAPMESSHLLSMMDLLR